MRSTSDPDVVDDASAARYEIRVGQERAGIALYRLGHDRAGRETITFTHTEIDDRFEGQGLGGRLARAALGDAGRRGLAVVPVCPFIAGYIDSHPEFRDMVAQGDAGS